MGLRRRIFGGARTRILAAFVVLMAFSTTVSVIAIYEVLVVRADDRLDESLQQEVEEFRQLASGINPETGKAFGDDLEAIFRLYDQRNVPGRGETIVMFVDGRYFDELSGGVGGRLTLGGELDRWAKLREPESGDVETPTETIRYLAVPVRTTGPTPRGVFVVAADLSAERDDVMEAVQLATLVLLTVLLIASALAWVVAGRLLAPLRVLDDTARSITETDLTRRIPVSGQDEIAELSRTFNAMVDRLEGAFASQRAFVSDASHELRTPITIVRGHLELLGDDPDERRETVALVTDELDRMSRFVDDLLLLAKAERSDFLRVDEVELGALTDELLDKAAGLGRREWSLEARGEAVLHADRQRLTQAVMGLAQNAVQHTQDGDAIWIGSGVDGDEASLWVRDSGPGVAAEDQGRVFERFARAAGSRRRSEGAGLGLAIVRAIAEAHGGRATLSSQPGAGSTFTVVVPLAGPEVSR
ncbi:ATP-binding protein [Solirubrobacter phytolaccae]|uniref:histidine kinase n=1 Tax=Solirubrobacter phytolaccae TaxID=1404360 RepID=A0A9X3SB90_9ACTN|nr:ATP-binding protein [Solirubrobacter phytolaccae]MDA0181115.1 ATP-binding protein [Solirubrobacter phytolaccae]